MNLPNSYLKVFAYLILLLSHHYWRYDSIDGESKLYKFLFLWERKSLHFFFSHKIDALSLAKKKMILSLLRKNDSFFFLFRKEEKV